MAMAPEIAGIITAAAQRHGRSPDLALRMAQIESRGDPGAFNQGSRASGLFQFIPSTARDYGLADPFDPAANADAAMRLMNDNAKALASRLGREPTDGEIYLAHQQGAGGASKLLANPDARAADLVGAKAVTANGGSADMTARDFANLWAGKFGGAGPSGAPSATRSAPFGFGAAPPAQGGEPAEDDSARLLAGLLAMKSEEAPAAAPAPEQQPGLLAPRAPAPGPTPFDIASYQGLLSRRIM